MSMMCEGDKIKDRVVDAVGRQEVIIREREKEANTILCEKVLTVEKQKKQKKTKTKKKKKTRERGPDDHQRETTGVDPSLFSMIAN